MLLLRVIIGAFRDEATRPMEGEAPLTLTDFYNGLKKTPCPKVFGLILRFAQASCIAKDFRRKDHEGLLFSEYVLP